MENEYREREEPKVRYEQQGNPMDAVKGKRGKDVVSSADADTGKRKAKGSVVAQGNEFRERPASVPGTDKGAATTKKARSAGKAPKRPNLLVQVLNGDILTRDFVLNNLTFIFFILFLLLLVVGKGYYGKQLTKDIDTLQTEVNASTAEYIENKAKLEESTTRYRLVEMLERRGLKESLKPAKVIRIKRPKK